MDSAKKEKWWQKTTFWGLAGVIVLHGIRTIGLNYVPPVEGLGEFLGWLEVGCGGGSLYGLSEIARSHARSTRDHADAKKEQVDLLLGRMRAKPLPDGPRKETPK